MSSRALSVLLFAVAPCAAACGGDDHEEAPAAASALAVVQAPPGARGSEVPRPPGPAAEAPLPLPTAVPLPTPQNPAHKDLEMPEDPPIAHDPPAKGTDL